MDNKKLTPQELFENNENFAAIFNLVLFDGEPIEPDDLKDLPFNLTDLDDGSDTFTLHSIVKQSDGKVLILAFAGLRDNPEREEHLVIKILACEGERYDWMIRENLPPMPCLTVVLYFGMEKSWPDDCISLGKYFKVKPPGSEVPDWKIPVLSMAFLDEVQRKKLSLDMGSFAEYLWKIRTGEGNLEVREGDEFFDDFFAVFCEMTPDYRSWNEFEWRYNERMKDKIPKLPFPISLKDAYERGFDAGYRATMEAVFMHAAELSRKTGIGPGKEKYNVKQARESKFLDMVKEMSREKIDSETILKVVEKTAPEMLEKAALMLESGAEAAAEDVVAS